MVAHRHKLRYFNEQEEELHAHVLRQLGADFRHMLCVVAQEKLTHARSRNVVQHGRHTVGWKTLNLAPARRRHSWVGKPEEASQIGIFHSRNEVGSLLAREILLLATLNED
jgi:glycogen debranching enzyme